MERQMSKLAVEVLSCLAREPVGQSLSDLSQDVFGKSDHGHRHQIRVVLDEISTRFGVVRDIAGAIHRPDGVETARPVGQRVMYSLWQKRYGEAQEYIEEHWRP